MIRFTSQKLVPPLEGRKEGSAEGGLHFYRAETAWIVLKPELETEWNWQPTLSRTFSYHGNEPIHTRNGALFNFSLPQNVAGVVLCFMAQNVFLPPLKAFI